MGARGPAKIQLRSSVHKCEICNKKFSSTAVLRSHKQSAHTFSTKTITKKGLIKKKPNQKSKIVIKPVVTAVPTQIAESSKRKSDRMKSDEPKALKADFDVKTDLNDSKEKNEVEFVCPKCPKVFPVYFYALKHIQKQHCVNSSGEKVSPDSIDLIKPIRKEVCTSCKKKYLPNEPHNCNVEGIKFNYLCSGCQQEFQTLKLFDLHITGVHETGVETLLFPTNNEFTNWKMQLEHQTKSKYTLLSKYQSKNFYRCVSLTESKEENVTACLCPSSIIVQEFPNGIYVNFYKTHHGHKNHTYTLSDRYKKYSMTSMINQSEGYTYLTEFTYDKNDLYMQFKKLMESIIVEAAKLNIDKLTNLIENALDMTKVLTNYNNNNDDDEDTPITCVEKDTKDTQIKIEKAIENLTDSKVGKRKLVVTTPLPRKILKVNNEKAVIKPKENEKEILIKPKKPKLNDEDVMKVLKELESDNEDEAKPAKTKLEQKTTEKVKPVTMIQSPSSFNDSYKDFVDKNFTAKVETKKLKRTRTPVQTVKTKIGQFNPTPKILNHNVENKKTVTFKKHSPKVNKLSPVKAGKADFDYEVIEQEDDCNVLVLKL